MDTDRIQRAPSAEFARLCLLVQRIADAETLSAAEAAALWETSDAARAAAERGDAAAARRHVTRLRQAIATLLEGEALPRGDARVLLPVLQAAEHLLNSMPDAGG